MQVASGRKLAVGTQPRRDTSGVRRGSHGAIHLSQVNASADRFEIRGPGRAHYSNPAAARSRSNLPTCFADFDLPAASIGRQATARFLHGNISALARIKLGDAADGDYADMSTARVNSRVA